MLTALLGCKGKKKEIPTGGPCEYREEQTTCDLWGVVVEDDGPQSIVTATYLDRMVRGAAAGVADDAGEATGPAPTGYDTFAYRLVVPSAEAQAVAATLRATRAVPCSVQRITSGTCVPMSITSVRPPGAPDAGAP